MTNLPDRFVQVISGGAAILCKSDDTCGLDQVPVGCINGES